MNKIMNAYTHVENMLRSRMNEGQMHDCLIKSARLAGGYLAAGALSQADIDRLGSLAESLALNPSDARHQWNDGVEFGKRDPVEVRRKYKKDFAIDWDTPLTSEMCLGSDENLEEVYLEPPDEATYDPCKDLIEYIETLFQKTEYVGYVTETFERDGKLLPTKGVYAKTAEEILKDLKAGQFDNAVGTVNESAGAWIRFNPLDGKGVSNDNVTAFRYALVECDNMPIEKQVATYRSLKLPCAFIVYSGGKSAHAIVHIDASTKEEYYERVKYLYDVCLKHGLELDRQNKNPSRLSRMPGAKRNDHYQYIIDRHTGMATFDDWKVWVEEQEDDLPPIESAESFYLNPPPLKPELISGILRQGHKMRIAGPSKGGKSFLLLELAIAIAEGKEWLGHQCAKGPVLYINLELDETSCKNRIVSLYHAMGLEPEDNNLHVWNLRGRALPMDKLTPKLVHRCASMGLAAIIIDPIYKVLTGDENSAADMAAFCNFFDRVSRDCGCAIIDCHHHSKGAQGWKRSMDRASGSGVFARDPDALLDMIELNSEYPLQTWMNAIECDAICKAVDDIAYDSDWRTSIGDDNLIVADRLMVGVERVAPEAIQAARTARVQSRESVAGATGWRIESTLREFPSFKALNVWFNYPVHIVDEGLLTDTSPVDPDRMFRKSSKPVSAQPKPDNFTKFRNLFGLAEAAGETYTLSKAAKDVQVGERSIRRYCKQANLTLKRTGEIVRE